MFNHSIGSVDSKPHIAFFAGRLWSLTAKHRKECAGVRWGKDMRRIWATLVTLILLAPASAWAAPKPARVVPRLATPIADLGPYPAEHRRRGSPGQYWQPFPPGPCDTLPRGYWDHVQPRYTGSYPRPNYYYAPHPNQVCADRWWRLWRS